VLQKIFRADSDNIIGRIRTMIISNRTGQAIIPLSLLTTYIKSRFLFRMDRLMQSGIFFCQNSPERIWFRGGFFSGFS